MKSITKIEPTKVRVEKKTRVAAYCRVSTGMEEQLISLKTQKTHYEQYIRRHPGWELAGLYYDEGISGTKKEIRPALLQMIADCEKGLIDRVVTKSLSRFSRNVTDCLELVRKLLDLGIPIVFEKENLDTGEMESELLLSIMSSLAESESVSISENMKWGMRHRFQNGTYKFSSAPYGYRLKDGQLIVNPEEAPWVQWMFAEFLSGKGTHVIARELNERQVPTRKKRQWTATTIRQILRNEKYIGDCLFQKTFTDTRYERHMNYGQEDQFYIEDHHEAIVSREDFEAVQALVAQRGQEKRIQKKDTKYANRYPFSGKLICGVCQSVLKRQVVTRFTHNKKGSKDIKHKKRFATWACREHLRDRGSCSMKAIQESDLEMAFTTMMNKLIFGRKEVLQNLQDRLLEQTRQENLERINEIEEMMEKNMDRRQTLIALLSQGYVEPSVYTQESNALDTKADQLTDERNRLIREGNGKLQKLEELEDLLSYVNHAEMSPSFNEELVARFIEKIVVHSRKEVTFYLKCGLKLKQTMR